MASRRMPCLDISGRRQSREAPTCQHRCRTRWAGDLLRRVQRIQAEPRCPRARGHEFPDHRPAPGPLLPLPVSLDLILAVLVLVGDVEVVSLAIHVTGWRSASPDGREALGNRQRLAKAW